MANGLDFSVRVYGQEAAKNVRSRLSSYTAKEPERIIQGRAWVTLRCTCSSEAHFKRAMDILQELNIKPVQEAA